MHRNIIEEGMDRVLTHIVVEVFQVLMSRLKYMEASPFIIEVWVFLISMMVMWMRMLQPWLVSDLTSLAHTAVRA